ncbi:MAG TPA: DinB family protein [Tepidisphaeraceae bacterium]|nr:DinB family protein [Tepidisphaeraceae bacterium]
MMNTPADVIAYSLALSRQMLGTFTADLNGADWLARSAQKANCAAWIIGHLVMTERRALTFAGVTDLPPLPAGFEQRFARDEHAAAAGDFGDTSILVPLFDQHRAMTIDYVKRATPEQLNKPLEKPTPRFGTVGEFAAFMAMHTMMHAGQITFIRRSLGRPPIV